MWQALSSKLNQEDGLNALPQTTSSLQLKGNKCLDVVTVNIAEGQFINFLTKALHCNNAACHQRGA